MWAGSAPLGWLVRALIFALAAFFHWVERMLRVRRAVTLQEGGSLVTLAPRCLSSSDLPAGCQAVIWFIVSRLLGAVMFLTVQHMFSIFISGGKKCKYSAPLILIWFSLCSVIYPLWLLPVTQCFPDKTWDQIFTSNSWGGVQKKAKAKKKKDNGKTCHCYISWLWHICAISHHNSLSHGFIWK